VAALLFGAGAAGCSGSKTSASASSTTSASASSTTSAPPSATVAAPVDLRSVLFDQFPATYIEEPVGVGVEGPLDLAAAATAQSSTNPTGAQLQLQGAGFLRGYTRGWVVKGTTPEFLLCRVLLFGSAQKALRYYDAITFTEKVDPHISTFPTPGLTDAVGFIVSYTDSQGAHTDYTIDMVAGRLLYHLDFGGPPGAVVPNDIVTIAHSQSLKAASLGY
jgi:hypothetical protein